MIKRSELLNKMLKNASAMGTNTGVEEFLYCVLDEMENRCGDETELLEAAVTITFSEIDLPRARGVLQKRIEERKNSESAWRYFEYILKKSAEQAVVWRLKRVSIDCVLTVLALEPDECMHEALGECCPTKYDLFDPEDIDDE